MAEMRLNIEGECREIVTYARQTYQLATIPRVLLWYYLYNEYRAIEYEGKGRRFFQAHDKPVHRHFTRRSQALFDAIRESGLIPVKLTKRILDRLKHGGVPTLTLPGYNQANMKLFYEESTARPPCSAAYGFATFPASAAWAGHPLLNWTFDSRVAELKTGIENVVNHINLAHDRLLLSGQQRLEILTPAAPVAHKILEQIEGPPT